MWIDPMVKWREDSSPGAVALLAGHWDEARAHFTEAGDLVGIGDVHLALGAVEEALSCFEKAAAQSTGVIVECGLSQALVWRGDASAAVQRLEQALTRYPGDAVLLYHLAGALLSTADQVRSVTRDSEPVITTKNQLVVCTRITDRLFQVAADPAHVAATRKLHAELTAGQQWIWSNENAALGYCLLAGVLGLGVAGVGGAFGSVVLVVVGALAGAGVVYAVVVGFRRQAWEVRAAAVAPMIWRHGLP